MANGLREIVVPFSGPVNLEATLECGQAFRWRRVEPPGCERLPIAYLGVIGSLALIVGQSHPVTRDIVAAWDGRADAESVRDVILTYFSDRDDICSIEDNLIALDEIMAQAVRHSRGLRILSQEPWECLGSYVLSLNNSIPNISRIVQNLAVCYGQPAGMGEFSFPGPEAIACQEISSLRQSKCGFRDRYLHDAAVKVASGEVDLQAVGKMPTQEARRELMKISGVGPKVADCVLLFGYHRLEVFPVDVWIARAMSRHYLGGRLVKPEEARQEGERRFGKPAGYAQEHLFHWIRTNYGR